MCDFSPISVHSRMRITLAMQELWLGGTITPAGARLAVRHVFQSAENSPLEVVYAFTLPRDAALRRFIISGEDFEMQSELLPTAEARKAYEQGLTKGRLSSLAQVYRDGLVNLTVGNIRPGEVIRVLLELVAGVESRDDGFRFRFPFTLAPGYHAQARTSLSGGQGIIELPEEQFGDVLLPPWQAGGELHRVGFGVEIRHPAGLAEVSSPSHPLRIGMGQEGGARAELAIGGDIPDRDLVLDVRAKQAAPCVLAGVDADGTGRMLALIPSPVFGPITGMARRLMFVIDRSGSMSGPAMVQALQAARACLGALTEEDAFGIVAFNDEPEVLNPELQLATREARQAADTFLQNIDARGGTELGAALQQAAAVLGEGGEVLLLTDGQVFGGGDILALAKTSGLRVHCLGIGSASQDHFLVQLARECGGVSRFMTARERVDLATLELFGAIGNPVAGDVAVSLSAESGAVQPEPPKQVYAGTLLAVFASGNPAREAILKVEWKSAGERRCLELPVAFADAELGETLKLLQGARIITDLEVRMAALQTGPVGRRTAKRQEDALRRAGKEYGLASRVMSLVAVVRRKDDRPGAVPITRVIPVGMPQDVAINAYFQPPKSDFAPILVVCEPDEDKVAMLSALTEQYAAAPDEPLLVRKLYSVLHGERVDIARFAAGGTTDEDFLVWLAGRLLPDGGMPGRDAEERLLASALALLAFAEMAQSTGTTAFDSHIRRLTGFLQGQHHPTLYAVHAALLERALYAVHAALLERALDFAVKATAPSGAIKLARKHLPFLMKTTAWKALRDLLKGA
jgi:Ca-activated chloride channel family protein